MGESIRRSAAMCMGSSCVWPFLSPPLLPPLSLLSLFSPLISYTSHFRFLTLISSPSLDYCFLKTTRLKPSILPCSHPLQKQHQATTPLFRTTTPSNLLLYLIHLQFNEPSLRTHPFLLTSHLISPFYPIIKHNRICRQLLQSQTDLVEATK